MTEATTQAPEQVRSFRDRLVQTGFSVVLDGSPGEWFVDATRNGRSQTVAWRPGRGFGFFAAPETIYGSGPDEIVEDVEGAIIRFRQLTGTDSGTEVDPHSMP